ncbi:MAG: hypothetical protein WA889_21470 [Xanthobacteraceae bacterium]
MVTKAAYRLAGVKIPEPRIGRYVTTRLVVERAEQRAFFQQIPAALDR